MSEDLDDPINILLTQIWNSREGTDRELCVIYLRSTAQKHLFAEERFKSLSKEIERYIQAVRDNQVLSRLNIEMDFDHCVSSLRSSLEHLAQLINAITPIKLSPKITKGEVHVTLKNVINKLERNELTRNKRDLSSLAEYLNSVMKEVWYRYLPDLRITMFHNKFDHLVRTTTLTLQKELIDLKFLLPQNTAKSLVTEEERNIISYCEDNIRKVEHVLRKSFQALSEYLLTE